MRKGTKVKSVAGRGGYRGVDPVSPGQTRPHEGRPDPQAPGQPGVPSDRPALQLAPDPDDVFRSTQPGNDGPAGQTPRRGVLVEFIRLIIVGASALAGWEVAFRLGADQPAHLLIGTIVGCGVGYVVGGMFGRRTATALSELEREFKRISAAEALAGAIGLTLGLIVGMLLSFPLFHLPARAAYPTVAFVYINMGYLGYKLGRAKSDELFSLFGVKPRAAGTRPGEVAVLDSSAILDGRILPLVRLGFLGGTLLVTRSVLEELQSVADSSNAGRRARGRKALDLVVTLRRDPSVDVVLIEDDQPARGEAVDVQLVRLAKARGGALVTNDSGLAKVAAALEVPVRSIHALAEALRPEVVAGEQVPVRLTRRGKEHGQAVGYLDDGTMVVVEDADHLLGDTVTASVTNALQTSTGRLIFARVAGHADGDEPDGEGA